MPLHLVDVSRNIRINPAEVRLYTGEPYLYIADRDGPVVLDLYRHMTRAQRFALARVGKHSGLLASTLRLQVSFRKTTPIVDLVAGTRTMAYAVIEDQGSRPHIIEAKMRGRGRNRRRGSLRFSTGGRVVFATRVMHPGTRGSRYLTLALDQAGNTAGV